MKSYVIDLENEDVNLEGIDNKNLIKLEVSEFYTRFSKEKQNRVIIHINKEAALTLGNELIKFHHNFDDYSEIHIDPIRVNHASMGLGIYLTKDSAELLILPANLGTVEDDILK